MSDGLVQIVREDLGFLMKEWQPAVDEGSLRRTSPVLRRLLVEKDLLKAWEFLGLGAEPVFEAVDAEVLAKEAPGVMLVMAGGAAGGNVQVREVRVWNRALSDAEIKSMYEASRSRLPQKLPFSRFRESACVVVSGRPVSRSDLVRYVSNKLGGAHYDEGRDKKHGAAFAETAKKLDEVFRSVGVADRDAIYHELLSIGQAFVRSPDIARIVS